MHTPRTISTLLLLFALGLTGCTTLSPAEGQPIEGSGTLAEETRPIGDVTAVELAMPGTLHIELGAASSLRISAEDNLLERIQTEARGGELVIQTSPGVSLLPREPIDYYLTVTGLDTLIVSSSGDVEAPDLVAPHFSVTISSSGNVSVRSLQAETLDVELSSSGNLIIAGGQVGRQEITLSSSGNYMAKDTDQPRGAGGPEQQRQCHDSRSGVLARHPQQQRLAVLHRIAGAPGGRQLVRQGGSDRGVTHRGRFCQSPE